MANKIKRFVDPAGLYNATYTSNVIETRANESSNSEKCIVQIEVSGDASVELQYRLDPVLSWVTEGTYTTNTLKEVPMAKYFRTVTTISVSGASDAFLQEIE